MKSKEKKNIKYEHLEYQNNHKYIHYNINIKNRSEQYYKKRVSLIIILKLFH